MKTSLMKEHPWDRWAVWIFFSLYLLWIFFTFLDYGITNDERVQNTYGEYILSYYTSGFEDTSALHYKDLWLYGGFFELLCAVANRILPFGTYETRHLLGGLFGCLGIYFAYSIANTISRSRWAGLLSALMLWFTPRYLGHSFTNPKDIPFAVFYLASLYYMILSIPHWHTSIPRNLLVKMGLAMGLALSIRVGGLILICYWGLFLFCHLCYQIYLKKIKFFPALLQAGKHFFGPVAVAYGIMYVFWPTLHFQSWIFPWEALQMASKYPFQILPNRFDGVNIKNINLPWFYFLRWLQITLPPVQMAALVLGIPLWISSRKKTGTLFRKDLSLLAFATLFPLCYILWKKPPVYNGLRHILFLLPGISIFASLIFYQFIKKLLSLSMEKKGPWMAGVVILFLLASFASTGLWYYQSHPYHYIYFNFTTGGLSGAFQKYDLDYYGSSGKEAAEWLNKGAPGLYKKLGRKIRVSVREDELCLFYYLNPNYFEYVRVKEKNWDFHAATTSTFYRPESFQDRNGNGRIYKEFKRMGVPIMVIYERVYP